MATTRVDIRLMIFPSAMFPYDVPRACSVTIHVITWLSCISARSVVVAAASFHIRMLVAEVSFLTRQSV